MFFHTLPTRAVLADINKELIDVYRSIRSDPAEVIRVLRRQAVTEERYYRIREDEPKGAAERAARFLYLNRTAFGGIYRLNLAGKFNVPYGGGWRTPEVLWKTAMLKSASSALRRARLMASDFEPVVNAAMAGDVVYCDPLTRSPTTITALSDTTSATSRGPIRSGLRTRLLGLPHGVPQY